MMRNANHLVKRFVEVLEDGERWERQVACTKAEAIDYIKHAMEYGFDEDCFDHVLMADGRSFHAQEEKLPANWQRDMVAWEQCNSSNTMFWVSGKADEGAIAWASYEAENDWDLMVECNDYIEAFLMIGDEVVDHHMPESEEEEVEPQEQVERADDQEQSEKAAQERREQRHPELFARIRYDENQYQLNEAYNREVNEAFAAAYKVMIDEFEAVGMKRYKTGYYLKPAILSKLAKRHGITIDHEWYTQLVTCLISVDERGLLAFDRCVDSCGDGKYRRTVGAFETLKQKIWEEFGLLMKRAEIMQKYRALGLDKFRFLDEPEIEAC